jgi:cell division septation protein DedD
MGVLAVLLATGVAAGGAFGATSKSKPFQAVVGHFKTAHAATTEMSKLTAKGFTGYVRETDKGKGAQVEVEKGFATQKQAKTAVASLHKKGFKGASVENEKSEKKVG